MNHDRDKLLADAEYFADELQRRLTGLERIEGVGRYRSDWQRAAGVTRSVRGYLRKHRDHAQRQRKLKARADAMRRYRQEVGP